MNYRSLLVCLDVDKQCATRVELAIRLARQHDCHLVAWRPRAACTCRSVPRSRHPMPSWRHSCGVP